MNAVSELNKQKLRLFVEAVLNQGQLELVDELVAADFIGRVGSGRNTILGPQAMRQLVSSGRRAHPGLFVKIEDQIAEEDRVVTRWQATTEPAEPGSPIGRVRCYEGIAVVRLLAGKQVDAYMQCTSSAPAAGFSSPLMPAPRGSSRQPESKHPLTLEEISRCLPPSRRV